MPTLLLPETTSPRRRPGLAAVLAALALLLAAYHYFTGEAHTLPWQLVTHLQPVPFLLDSVAVGSARLPLPVNGYLTTITHDVAGPNLNPAEAALWLGLLALALAGWLAVVSTLPRPAFLVGTAPVILLLLSLNLDALGVFDSTKQYFLGTSLGVLGAAALGLQVFGESVPLRGRVAIFGSLIAALVGVLAWKTTLPATEAILQTAAYATPAGMALVALLVLWIGVENIRALVWFNTQAERPESRFGLLPLLLASGLYLGTLALYYWNDGEVALLGGLHLDPLVLLLPAVLTGGLGLRQRAASFGTWVPLAEARPLYWLLVTAAAAALGYALATANAPLLAATRDFSVLALGLLGTAFLLYVLINFGSLLQQRLRVYRVVFEPRRLPFLAVYVLALVALLALETRNNWLLLSQVSAGQYNQLGDLTRRQSEAHPDDLYLAALAERYYAESGDVLARFNRSAQLGRAALYAARDQPQNELNALHRALLRHPDDKISAQFVAQLTEPTEFLDALDALRQGRRAAPRSFPLTSDLAQLFTRSSLTDSVAFYLDRAERLAPGSYVSRTNRLAFLLSQKLYSAALKLAGNAQAAPDRPAQLANENLLHLLTATRPPAPAAVADGDLDAASFAQVHQAVLLSLRTAPAASQLRLLPILNKLTARPANAAYYEQLLLLQALVCHASGQEVAARQLLAPLTVGTDPVAGYYQYVLGLWQLQQEQYGTAATQLGQAARSSFGLAAPAQLFARFLNSPPDSTAALDKALRLLPDSAAKQTARRLLKQARAGEGIRTGQWAGYINSLGDANQPDKLRDWLEKKGNLLPVGAAFYGQAVLARLRQQPAVEQQLYARIVKEAPFNETAILAAARHYTSQHDASTAYEALRVGLLENPDSAALLQAFALTAADAGLADLGQSALDQLHQRLSPAAYANLLAQFAARRAAYAAAMASFSN
ncbi:MAG: hypothetical protein ACRYFX_07465 [Janthinobacterium lividum]